MSESVSGDQKLAKLETLPQSSGFGKVFLTLCFCPGLQRSTINQAVGHFVKSRASGTIFMDVVCDI